MKVEWVALTNELLNQIDSGEFGNYDRMFWIVTDSKQSPRIAMYGRCPHIFTTIDGYIVPTKKITHIATFELPELPQ